ncbi:GNAT family N-acetyltransferase [Sphingobacterium faecale]|uniref:N-acetyltransferase n=1 Tax=Sphingobacterium faecale TaxID=2803775 RepID=A0ABS1QXH7_9SPHI|nr:N-acetyltransferase [Sphingobacterium faecale]MBL1407133.1 N-acetyltransferase [Sphingobacterium faecale]
MHIRQANNNDYQAISILLQEAFKEETHSDHREHLLVQRLQGSTAFIPELSLVAELNHQIVGYILLTRIRIVTPLAEGVSALALAPVAVSPSHQRKGIGSRLINYAHETARNLGFGSVVVLGHEDYYPRLGYKMAKDYNVSLPFDVPEKNCMILELQEDALRGHSGQVIYPKEFMG